MTLCLSTTSWQFGHTHSFHRHNFLWPFKHDITPWLRHLAHFGVRNNRFDLLLSVEEISSLLCIGWSVILLLESGCWWNWNWLHCNGNLDSLIVRNNSIVDQCSSFKILQQIDSNLYLSISADIFQLIAVSKLLSIPCPGINLTNSCQLMPYVLMLTSAVIHCYYSIYATYSTKNTDMMCCQSSVLL